MNTEEKNLNELMDDDSKIDIFELLFVLRQKLLILILAFVVAAAGAGIYTSRFTTPVYKAASTIYISPAEGSAGELRLGTLPSADYKILATSREVLESVVEDLGLNMTYETLRKMVDVSVPFGSHMLVLTVSDKTPQQAADISNVLADELRQRIADVMRTDMPSVAERAVAPFRKAGPSVPRNALLAGTVLMVLTAAVILALHLLDDSIHTEEDIKRYLKLNNLAMIPKDKSRPDRETQLKKPDKRKRKK